MSGSRMGPYGAVETAPIDERDIAAVDMFTYPLGSHARQVAVIGTTVSGVQSKAHAPRGDIRSSRGGGGRRDRL